MKRIVLEVLDRFESLEFTEVRRGDLEFEVSLIRRTGRSLLGTRRYKQTATFTRKDRIYGKDEMTGPIDGE